MFKLSSLILGLILVSTPALSQKYFGPGDKSCGTWTADRRTDATAALAYDTWVLGFVSGINTSETISLNHPDILKRADVKGIIGWMDNYCASHPLDSVISTVIKLVVELRKNAD
jgi:hypothetical protein